MSRYIDADLIQYEPMLRPQGNGNYEDCEIAYRDEIDNIPTADVRENVKGAWLKGEYYSNGYKEEWIFPYCSICHYETDKMYKFCPNCGADMRGDKS